MKWILAILILFTGTQAVELEQASRKQIFAAVLAADSTRVEAAIVAIKASDPQTVVTDDDALDLLILQMKDFIRSAEIARIRPTVAPALLDSTATANLWPDPIAVRDSIAEAISDSLAGGG